MNLVDSRLQSRRVVIVLAATLGWLAAPLAAGQSQDLNPQTATILDEVTVNIVNIDVHVTDRRGRPISDLSIEDFEIFEEGEQMEVTNFLNAATRRDADDLEWTEGESLEGLDETGPPLMVALYLDRYRTYLGNLRRIERDLVTFLTSRGERADSVRFMLATGDPDLNIRVPFTSDPGELTEALRQIENEPRSPAHDNELFRRRILQEIRQAYEACALVESRSAIAPDCEPCVDLWPSFLGSADQYAAEMQSRAAASISALADLVTALGGLPGPKAVIYVSDGLPQQPGAEVYHYLGEVCPENQMETDRRQTQRDETTRFNRFSAFSNANRVTLYPIDAGGVRGSSAVDARFGGPVGAADGGGAGGLGLANVLVPSNRNDRLRVDNLQSTLSLLADETGGRAVFNEAHPAEALEEIAADFGSYYSLGYAAPPERRYSIRQIEVRLTKPKKGWRVRYRRSYILKSGEQRLADRLYAALKLGEQSNPLGADVTFGEIRDGAVSEQATLPVEVHVPVASVTRLPGPSGSNGTVRIFLVAGNDEGDRTPMRQKALTLSEAQLAPQLENTLVVVNLNLPPGRFDVAVGIRDEATGRSSYLVKNVQIP